MSKAEKQTWFYGRKGIGDHIFDTCNVIFMIFMIIITLYPFLFVLFSSFSEPLKLMAHRGLLLSPVGFTTDGYVRVFKNTGLLRAYGVTLELIVLGTACSMAASLLFAYVLSRRDMMWHGLITFLAVFTMYFGGGMIPTYVVVSGLGLLDSIWSLILPGLIGTYNVIIIRTAIHSVPDELTESARLDGAKELTILVRILIPLIVPTIAAISLFYMVGYWNSWSNALIYIQTPAKFPLQLLLRSILIENNKSGNAGETFDEAGGDYAARQLLKYSTIIVSVIPVVCVYPFLQKYFTKGVMIGAIKG